MQALLPFVPSALLTAAPAQAMAQKLFEPTIWYASAPNGEISVNITKAEMGQHVGTALAQLLQSWRPIELMCALIMWIQKLNTVSLLPAAVGRYGKISTC